MDQVKLFGEHVRYFFDFLLQVPYLHPNISFTPFGVSKCFGPNSGPVHFNCMFSEPLEPVEPTLCISKPHSYSHPNNQSQR